MNNNTLIIEDDYNYEDLNISVVDFVKQDLSPNRRLEKRKLKHSNLFYAKQGRGIYYIDDKLTMMSKGDLLYIPKGSSVQIFTDKRDSLQGYTLEFEYSWANGMERILPFPRDFNIGSNIILKDLYERLDELWGKKIRGYRLVTKAIVLLMFNELIFRIHDDESKEDNRVEIIKDYILENYTKDIRIEDISDILNLNPVYLGSYFKQKTGYSIRHYINSVRVNKSKILLSSGQYSVGSVAEKCGYQDVYYFSKVFKKIEGIPPSTFAK